MSIAKYTEEQLRAIVREEIAAALAPKPAALPALRPFASLGGIERSAVLDFVGLGRFSDALNILRSNGAAFSASDARPYDLALAREQFCRGGFTPDDRHFPGWRALLAPLRPFSDKTPHMTGAESLAREDVERLLVMLASPVSTSVAASVDGAAGYYRGRAKALALTLSTWRWTLTPADLPTAGAAIGRALAAGWLATSPNLPADAWSTTSAAA